MYLKDIFLFFLQIFWLLKLCNLVYDCNFCSEFQGRETPRIVDKL